MSVDQVAHEKLARTVIEVIDPVSARVVARRIIDSLFVASDALGRAVFYNTDADGLPFLEVVQLRLLGR